MSNMIMDASWEQGWVSPTRISDPVRYSRHCARRAAARIERLFAASLGLFLWACVLALLVGCAPQNAGYALGLLGR